ncbi:class I glutamine amidotransferase-like protein [Aspergillus taichungensis]|uniref:Class I glutamine amidotransferase-like protein n=1 Tax=Aspergillus taichungensis TaxID=482145 RepID=A0A2J5HVS6_9EURO|nr:class I glutamine amidotransferase-like protein [Aspergillus taichungensis]
MSPTHKIGLLLYPNADLLDFAGPLEVFSHALHNYDQDQPDRIFSITTLARTQSISVGKDSLNVTANVVLNDNINNDEAISQLLSQLDFDILLVPGAPPAVVTEVSNEVEGVEKRVVRGFVGLGSTPNRERILFSVCTGSVVLGAAGVLGGMRATTHYLALGLLDQICRTTGEGKVDVVEVVEGKRFVDGGLLHAGGQVRLITSGAISSGIDAALFVVKLVVGPEMAEFVVRVMEYEWRE